LHHGREFHFILYKNKLNAGTYQIFNTLQKAEPNTTDASRLVTLNNHDTKAAAEYFAPHSFMTAEHGRTKN
jgi:hypothetical protein